jgi:hypothetical protein
VFINQLGLKAFQAGMNEKYYIIPDFDEIAKKNQILPMTVYSIGGQVSNREISDLASFVKLFSTVCNSLIYLFFIEESVQKPYNSTLPARAFLSVYFRALADFIYSIPNCPDGKDLFFSPVFFHFLNIVSEMSHETVTRCFYNS